VHTGLAQVLDDLAELVRWAIGSIVVSRAIRSVIPTVRSRVPPPAP
jgi:hypothetical protein